MSDILRINQNIFTNEQYYSKRVSSGITGSMTVEAALVVPLFILCMINLLFGIQVMETSSRITAALHETGNEICSYGYAVEHGVGEDIPAGIAGIGYAVAATDAHLGHTVNSRGGILGGVAGIDYLGSSVLSENGIVKLSAEYVLKFPVKMGIRSFALGTSYYGHAWVGYDGLGTDCESAADDPVVYITPSGSVYHTDINCRYLNPSIRSVPSSSVSSLRSNDGSKYYPCEMCGAGAGVGHLYVTDYGNRYHSDLYCSGIKRDIRAVHLSEVGGRGPCSNCGGW